MKVADEIESGLRYYPASFFEVIPKVNAAVQAQQAQETILVQTILHQLPAKTNASDPAAKSDQAAADGLARDKNLFAAAKALVVPIRHTIKIEPEL